MARADAGNGMSHSELFDILKLLGSDKDRAERIKYGSRFVRKHRAFNGTSIFILPSNTTAPSSRPNCRRRERLTSSGIVRWRALSSCRKV